MKAKNYSETQRLIFEREITDKFFEGELPVTETITERVIEHEPTVTERADEELKAAEAEYRARETPNENPTEEVINDYDEPADKRVWDEYERKVNQEMPREPRDSRPPIEHPQSRHTIEDRIEGEKAPEETPEEILEEMPDEAQEEAIIETLDEIDVELPETEIDLNESDTEIGPEIEWDFDIDYDQDPDYDYEY